MSQWLKDRLEIINLTLRHRKPIVVFAVLQAVQLTLALPSITDKSAMLAQVSNFIPWYGWVTGWLVLLWFASIEYSLERKEVFDQTSLSFFKAFLEFLINEGANLFNDSEDKNFYSRIKFWQQQVIQGIAIGLGPGESEKYFHKVESLNSLTAAYRESMKSNSNEPLCGALRDNLEELKIMRMNLAGTKIYEKGELEAVKNLKKADEPGPEAKDQANALQVRK